MSVQVVTAELRHWIAEQAQAGVSDARGARRDARQRLAPRCGARAALKRSAARGRAAAPNPARCRSRRCTTRRTRSGPATARCRSSARCGSRASSSSAACSTRGSATNWWRSRARGWRARRPSSWAPAAARSTPPAPARACSSNAARTPLVARIEARIAALLRWPVENGEGLQILRYRPGEEYKPHYDYFDPAQPGAAAILARGGQRLASLVMYLEHAGAAAVRRSFPTSASR